MEDLTMRVEKRKIAIAGSVVALVGVLAGGYVAADGGREAAQHPAAAQPGHRVRAQAADSNVDPFADTRPNPPAFNLVNVKVRNFGAFAASVCISNSFQEKRCNDNDIDVGPRSTTILGAIPAGQPAVIVGRAIDGKQGTLRLPVDKNGTTFCVRFDGTTQIGFKFSKVECTPDFD
jgi:hypothetical protein